MTTFGQRHNGIFRSSLLHLLIGVIMIEASTAMQIMNCYECAQRNSGRNNMCNFAGRLPSSDPYSVACCDPNDSHEYCQTTVADNTCSPSYNEAQHNFYTYCPRINSTGCGIYDTASSQNFEIEASTTNQSFTFDALRYKDAAYKFKSVDACYYQVMNPTLYYSKGNIKVRFDQIEKGVKLYINAGSDVRNCSVTLVDYNRTVTVGDEFELD